MSRPLAERFARHRKVSQQVKSQLASMGLQQLAADPANQANGMTAVYLPDGIAASSLLPKLLDKGVILAGGLHKEIKTKYIRMGHMGVSVVRAMILPVFSHYLAHTSL